MSSRHILAGLAATVALAVPLGGPLHAASPGAATASTAAATPRSLDLPPGTLVAPGPAADLEILFTGDVIGYIEPCG